MMICQKQLYLLTTLLAAFLVFSCRSEPKQSASSMTAKAPSSLQIRLLAEPDGLSPILARKGTSRLVYRHLFSRLIEIDPISSEYLPQLASEMPKEETLENGSTKFTYTIRPAAAWSDGKPLTTQDILFSYKLIKHPGISTRYGPIADLINDIQINPEDSNQISFIADECHITLMTGIAEMYIYPEHIFDPEQSMRALPFSSFLDKEKIAQEVKGNNQLAEVGVRFMDPEYVRDPSKFVTSSAYTFKEWITGQRITIERNENWWGNDVDSPIFKKQAKEIQFQIIPDNNTALVQLANGELDAISSVVATKYDEYKDKESLQAKTSPAHQIIWLALNTQKGLLADKYVRLALAHTCDVQSIIDNALDGYGHKVTGPFMPGSKESYDEIKLPPLDIDQANSALKASGWSDSDQDGIMDKMIDGKKTNLTLEFSISNKSTTGPIIAELIKTSAKKAGIDINIVLRDIKTNSQNVKKGNFDIYLTGTTVQSGLPDPKGRWHTESFPPNGLNYPRFGNAESDKIIEQIVNNCDNEEERTKQYHRLHAMIAAEQPVIFLYNPMNLFLINKKFDNVVVSPNRPGLFEEFLTLK